MPDVIALGMPVMDLLMQIDHLPTFNQGAHTIDSSWQYGGKVASAIVAVARLGHSGGIVAPIGGLAGQYIKADFDRHGVDTSRLVDPNDGSESPFCLCLADESTGGRSILVISKGKGVKMPLPEELDRAYLTSGKYLLISGGEPASAAAVAWCREAGVPVVIDADGYSDDIRSLLPLIDHFIPSEFFYEHIFGNDDDYEKNLHLLRAEQKNQHATTIVTLGERGVAGIDDMGEYFTVPAYQVKVIDTTGAGDVFHGAYIVGLLEGMSVKDACQFASAVAAIKCANLGGRAGVPTMEVTKKFMQTGQIDSTEIDERIAYYRKIPFKG